MTDFKIKSAPDGHIRHLTVDGQTALCGVNLTMQADTNDRGGPVVDCNECTRARNREDGKEGEL
jgi:hypothetical protein